MLMRHGERGVTLIEMLAVLVIIGIIAMIVVPNVMDRVERGRVEAAKAQIKTLDQSCRMFRLDQGKYPDTLNDLVTAPGWIKKPFPEGGYLGQPAVPIDPWGNPFAYEQNAPDFLITCYGRDGVPGGTGLDADITNRDLQNH